MRPSPEMVSPMTHIAIDQIKHESSGLRKQGLARQDPECIDADATGCYI